MGLCLKIGRMLPVLGLALFGSFYVGSAQALPLCSQVFAKAISQQEISATVASLAQMKLRLDLLKADGSNTKELQFLNEQYPIKLTEMQRALSDKYSEKEIRDLLVKEIEKQQGRDTEETARETSAREVQKSLFPSYSHSRTISLPRDFRGRLEYIPEHGYLLFESYMTGIMRMDLKTNDVQRIADAARYWYLLPDRQTILFRSNDNQISKINIRSGEAHIVGNLENDGSWTQVDPKGEALLTSGFREFEILDLTTGKTTKVPSSVSGYPHFISKTKLLFAGDQGAYILNTETHITESIKKANPQLQRCLILSQDRFVLYNTNGKAQFFDLNNLSKPYHSIGSKLTDSQSISDLTEIPKSNFIIAKKFRNTGMSYEWGIYDIYGVEYFQAPIFQFSGYQTLDNSIPRPEGFYVAPDSRSLAVLVNHNPSSTVATKEVQIWERR